LSTPWWIFMCGADTFCGDVWGFGNTEGS